MLYTIYVGKTDASYTKGGLRFAIELVKIFHLSSKDLEIFYSEKAISNQK